MKYYIKDDFYFEVTNGGSSTGTEYGYVTITFEKDGDEHEIRFDIYQVAGGSETIDFIEIEDLVVAKEYQSQKKIGLTKMMSFIK